MNAPERIWAFSADDIAENEGGATIVAHESYQSYATEYVRADLASVQPTQDEQCPACGTLHPVTDRVCPDCKAEYLSRPAPQPDPSDEVIARLVEALEHIRSRAVSTRGDQAYREFPRFVEKASRTALAAAKAVRK